MRTKQTRRGSRALTIVELLLVLVACGLLLALLLPATARRCNLTAQTRCLNNLKQVSLGMLLFRYDNEEFPWNLSPTNGGTSDFKTSTQVYRHFAAASNDLGSPKILTCRSDVSHQNAELFSMIANTNISYFVNIDATSAETIQPLAGDRRILGGAISNGFLLFVSKKSPVSWAPNIHNESAIGNLAMTDGSADGLSSKDLPKRFASNNLPVMRLAIP